MRASMGPGSFDPGSPSAAPLRIWLNAASMGPGSFDPGSPQSRPPPRPPQRRASMGPGSFDPGSVKVTAGFARGALCFNGAGVFRPRKFEIQRPCQEKYAGFNGAGVFRPRKSRHSAPKRYFLRMLQWGRGLSTPEVILPCRYGRDGKNASMGPGSFDPGSVAGTALTVAGVLASMGPGSFDPGVLAPYALRLRMGSASMGPGSFDPGSGPCLQANKPRRPRFNGAGVFRPRK